MCIKYTCSTYQYKRIIKKRNLNYNYYVTIADYLSVHCLLYGILFLIPLELLNKVKV